MWITALWTILPQIFYEISLNFQIIVKNILDADDKSEE